MVAVCGHWRRFRTSESEAATQKSSEHTSLSLSGILSLDAIIVKFRIRTVPKSREQVKRLLNRSLQTSARLILLHDKFFHSTSEVWRSAVRR